MKQATPFVTTARIQALLCCSAAVLLTACGGGMSDSSSQAAHTAGYAYSSGAVAPAAASFDLAGYASHPLNTGAAPQAAPAVAADGTPALLASSVAIDVTASATTPATTINYYVSPTGRYSRSGVETRV